MTKHQNFIVSLELFPFEVMFHFGPRYELLPILKERISQAGYRLIEDELRDVSPTINGKTLMDSHSGVTIVWLPYAWSKATTPNWYGILSHEIFHAVEFILDLLEVPLSEDTSEVYAYAIQHLTTKVFENLKA